MTDAIHIKRVYAPPEPGDGQRVLVDRLWPRGVSKQAAALSSWMKEVAPSQALRQWFDHDPARWQEFHRRYTEELRADPSVVEPLRDLLRSGPVTLLYGAHDTAHNNAVVLADFLRSA